MLFLFEKIYNIISYFPLIHVTYKTTELITELISIYVSFIYLGEIKEEKYGNDGGEGTRKIISNPASLKVSSSTYKPTPNPSKLGATSASGLFIQF